MAETALREKWTGLLLDDLNHVVARRFKQLDRETRAVRTDIERLTNEMNDELNHFNRGRSSREGSLDRDSFKRHHPEITAELTWGESWTDERIYDLNRTLSDDVTSFDMHIHGLREEFQALRNELTARLDALSWRRRLRRRGSLHPAASQCRRRTSGVAVALRSSGPWTDGRLDDFNYSVDLALARLECNTGEIKSEVEALLREMRECLRARFKTQYRITLTVLCAIAAVTPLSILAIATIAN
jgi:hypothetical protein